MQIARPTSIKALTVVLLVLFGCSRSEEQGIRRGQAKAQPAALGEVRTDSKRRPDDESQDCIRGTVALNDFVQRTHELARETNELVVERQAAKYVGTCCEVWGPVISVWREESYPGQIAVSLRSSLKVPLLSTGDPSAVVWSCLFPDSYEAELSELAEGDTIRVRGKYLTWEKPVGHWDTYYGFTDCELLR